MNQESGEFSSEGPALDEHSILVVGAIVESILALSALIGVSYFEIPVLWDLSLVNIGYGILGAAILFTLNKLFLYLGELKGAKLFKPLSQFRDTIARPLAKSLQPSNALALSILAGLCEELFFRGFLQPLIGIILTALAFVLLHFGPRLRQPGIVILVYFVVSLFFSVLYGVTNSLWSVIIAHALYDAIVLFELRKEN